ncbi:hypothetical protein SFBM_0099 [Candidatus Arthromitus sp. SFB-mouse-Japan]|uniref:hypothetical protein n=1 Tax=unclassified Candidatus Neoarthromitus TaxID=2638829 RepID=UPI00021B8080|nr:MULTISPECIES: hypothetical protein [unclassified Candidatus Arthromitus]EIA22154.1 hypothetical protein SFB2_270G5 [Candidatus Arthromitus sp. SFB-2]EIA23446.1 hypothetical protein SFB1_163G12 [Candidatus Arthromitus sp. SFB-1]EIA27650.1 hypothetical protein SFB5_188G1 [Candidatus Arthromitus sp. SFB-5]EIA28097.1 hypothetical protein SFB6_068G11 [Candidatus Arthromitus sp. SFB-co]EIA31331.1 hypothetical protein SFBSU_002G61 [Candidatus Arthromitus sp. SFB-mouse-SU]EIA31575.1 hypothetical p
MIRKQIESLIGQVDDRTYAEALKMTEADIKANRLSFNLKTQIEDFILILINSIKIIRRK